MTPVVFDHPRAQSFCQSTPITLYISVKAETLNFLGKLLLELWKFFLTRDGISKFILDLTKIDKKCEFSWNKNTIPTLQMK